MIAIKAVTRESNIQSKFDCINVTQSSYIFITFRFLQTLRHTHTVHSETQCDKSL
jgi:hypothetical protein